MRLDSHFLKLIENISLDDTRRKRVESAYVAIKELLQNDEEIKKRFVRIFLQGSYVIGTLIRPTWRKEYDIDLVLVLNLKDASGRLFDPAKIMEWVANRIKNNGAYKDKVESKNRCVRINYTGDFRLDVTPVHAEGTTLFAPSKDRSKEQWGPTNPEGYISWCNAINVRTRNKFQLVTKMLKHWRDVTFSKETSPKSIMFTKLIGDFIYAESSSVAENLSFTMKRMNAYFQMQGTVPKIDNPALSQENLARDWTQENYNLFREKFKNATTTAEQALNDPNEKTSIDKWQQLFKDAFPSTLSSPSAAMLGAIPATFPDRPVRPNKPGGFA